MGEKQTWRQRQKDSLRQEREKMRGRGQGPGTEGGRPEEREKKSKIMREKCKRLRERQEQAAARQRRNSPLLPFPPCQVHGQSLLSGLGAVSAGNARGMVLDSGSIRISYYSVTFH